jgi:hypothetical protein
MKHVPIVYGLVRDLEPLRKLHPQGFVLGGDLVRSSDDPGPNRKCHACGYRFHWQPVG